MLQNFHSANYIILLERSEAFHDDFASFCCFEQYTVYPLIPNRINAIHFLWQRMELHYSHGCKERIIVFLLKFPAEDCKLHLVEIATPVIQHIRVCLCLDGRIILESPAARCARYKDIHLLGNRHLQNRPCRCSCNCCSSFGERRSYHPQGCRGLQTGSVDLARRRKSHQRYTSSQMVNVQGLLCPTCK